MNKMDMLAANTVRILGAEAVQKANSGHPGIVLGAAPMGVELFFHHINHDPDHPDWINRDRFILSAGHGSMLLYPLLHLFGYIPMEEIQNFRQWGSLTPGHPEYRHTPGVDATTGPLGQGIGMAVGMAASEAHLGAAFNQEGYPVFDHYTYVLCGDGCLQEGVSGEASSLAGTWGLGKLIVLYDSNHITIEGSTDLAFTEDVALRYASYGWQVLQVADGEDFDALRNAIEAAKADESKPSIIIVETKIGRHSKLEGSEKTHGSPLGEDNVAALKQTLDWNAQPFTVLDEVYDYAAEQVQKHGRTRYDAWQNMLQGYAERFPEQYNKLQQYTQVPQIDWDALVSFGGPAATRSTSGKVLNALADRLPNLIGGSADLGPSNKSTMDALDSFAQDNYAGRNMHFGVREHGMGAIVNGMALYGNLRPYGATFLVFSDYMRGSLRLSALMDLPVFFLFTHDSIGVGEDGPTHQPIEHLAALRALPNLAVFRPADGNETIAAYQYAITKGKPTAMALSRQDLPQLGSSVSAAAKGGYVLVDSAGQPDVILIGTGSEVFLCVDAAKQLADEGIAARVVSLPCVEVFLEQSADYRESVLPSAVRARISVEAGSTMGWHRFVGDGGIALGIDHFGASAPGETLFEEYGFTAKHVAEAAKKVLGR
ncbi:transketolase [Eubacteriales bacterium OttesenSCG-928-N14]|nr:transketolase [Eubacteriales bacterium OttesenSCG-928-N14]